MYSSLTMTTKATPLSTVNTILSGFLLISAKAFLCSLVRLALGAGSLFSKLHSTPPIMKKICRDFASL